MTEIWRFARLDYITIRAYLTWKTLLIFAVVALAIGFGLGNSVAVIAVLAAMVTIWTSYPFAIGEKSDLDIFYTTLGLRRSTVVAGRYLFGLVAQLLAGLVGYILAAGLLTATGKGFDPVGALVAVAWMFALFGLIQAFQFPIIFRVGFTKARLLMYIPLAGFPIVVLALGYLAASSWGGPALTSAYTWAAHHPAVVAIIAVVVWIAAMVASFAFAVRFYARRDF